MFLFFRKKKYKEDGKKKKKIMLYGDCHMANLFLLKYDNSTDELIFLVKVNKKNEK